jgi:hypothetical protein
VQAARKNLGVEKTRGRGSVGPHASGTTKARFKMVKKDKIEDEIRILLSETKTRVPNLKVKVKLSLCLTKHHAIKAYWGSGGTAPRILDLGTRWR